MVDIEEKNARKFEEGSRGNIKGRLKMLQLPTYAEVMNCALLVERSNEEHYKDCDNKKRGETSKGPRGSNINYFKKQNTRGTNKNYYSLQSRESYPQCPKCKKYHNGHMVRDCSNRSQSMVISTRKGQPHQARVFALVPGDVQTFTSVVSGILTIDSHFTHV